MKLTVANSTIDAHLIVGFLSEAGIETRMEPDRSGLGEYLHAGSNPNAPVGIFVPVDDLEAATEVHLSQVSEEGAEEADEQRPLAAGRPPRSRQQIYNIAIGIVVIAATIIGSIATFGKLLDL